MDTPGLAGAVAVPGRTGDMKASRIPESSRTLVRVRELSRCARCQVPAPNGHWHHRRSRSVRDPHTHHPCNGVWLCPPCHNWVHRNPRLAREAGLILPRATDAPWNAPFHTPLGWRLPDCEGQWTEPL